MRSKEQEIEMLEKLSKILKLLPHSRSIKEISEQTNIPTSTIQRYLNKKELIVELLELNNNYEKQNEATNYIQNWLNQSKNEGHKRGGLISQEKYGYIKAESGKFSGNRKNK